MVEQSLIAHQEGCVFLFLIPYLQKNGLHEKTLEIFQANIIIQPIFAANLLYSV